MTINSDNMDNRQIRGYAIISKGDEPKQISLDSYLIPSQSSKKKYIVKNRGYSWICECPDFANRKRECKHIHAIKFWLSIKQKLEDKGSFELEEEVADRKCVYCKSENIVKNGNRKCKTRNKQRFLCRDCKKTFIQDKEFSKIKGDPKIITLVLDLYFKGISLRKIQDHLKQFYKFKVHHETIRKWILKFTRIMNVYTDKLQPKVSEAWHTDEQMVKVKGKHIWSWNILDEKTRFLIANKLTEKREINDARQIFSKAKEVVKTRPEFIITDGLWSYEEAIKKEFPAWWRNESKINHIRLKTIRDKIHNNLIERYHSSFRERDKVMRGFKKIETTQLFLDGYRTYYNFIRPHMSLNNMTPAQKSNINLNLQNNKWLSLIKISSIGVKNEN